MPIAIETTCGICGRTFTRTPEAIRRGDWRSVRPAVPPRGHWTRLTSLSGQPHAIRMNPLEGTTMTICHSCNRSPSLSVKETPMVSPIIIEPDTLNPAQHNELRAARKGTFGFHGYLVNVQGFDGETFTRAINRTLDEGVRLEPTGQPGTFRATRPGSPTTYTVSGTACSCPADQRGVPCKHRALAILILAVTSTPSRGP